MQKQTFYRPKALVKQLAWIGLLALGCKYSMGMAFVVMLPLSFMWVLSGKSNKAMLALLIATASMMMNDFFMPKSVPFYAIQKMVVLGFGGVMILRMSSVRRSHLIAPTLLLVPYLIYIACVSQMGWSPIISNFKMLLFAVTYAAFYGCATLCAGHSSSSIPMRESILCMSIIFIVGSLLLIPFPGISLLGSDEYISYVIANPGEAISLFKGMAKHSQTLGPTVAMLVVILLGDWVFAIQRKDRLYLALILLGPIVLYKTSSRTAMGTMIAGVGLILFFAMHSRGGIRSWRRKVVSTAIFLSIAFSVVLLAIPSTRGKVTKFVIKNTSETKVEKEVVLGSRQYKLDEAMRHWRESPVFGNGFQVSEEMQGAQIRGIRDILTAPVEKSTWTYAVLEEGGVIGLILFSLFVVLSIWQLAKRRAYIGASVLFAMIVSNLGEFGIFSMSNQGGFYWALTFSALVLDSIRIKEERALRFDPTRGAPQVQWRR